MWMTNYGQVNSSVAICVCSKIQNSPRSQFWKMDFTINFGEVSPCSFSDKRHILLPQPCPWPQASFQRLVKEILTDLQAQMRQPDRDLLEMEENAAGFWCNLPGVHDEEV
jgi:hypothetical protein